MAVQIKAVETKSELRKFVRFANKLYKGNEYYVPSMPMDDMNTFNREKNGAYDFCDVELYLAYKDGKLVGRVAAIINYKANEAWKANQVRFGWIDFIDDIEVSSALLDAVVAFGKAHGMTQVVGPLGFTDFDPEGMLVEGFDRLSTMALIYNYPYYPEHMKKLGYYKETGWVEYRITIPTEIPEKHRKVAEIVTEKYGLKVRKMTKRQIRKERYGHKLFHLINETYCVLYGYSLLSEKQIDSYVDVYLSLVNMDMLTFIEDGGGRAHCSRNNYTFPFQGTSEMQRRNFSFRMVPSSQCHVLEQAGHLGHAPYRCKTGLAEQGNQLPVVRRPYHEIQQYGLQIC